MNVEITVVAVSEDWNKINKILTAIRKDMRGEDNVTVKARVSTVSDRTVDKEYHHP